MISIIVPVYNTSQFLDRCLQSLVSQTYKDIEIILIDDCSTDNSAEIMRQWETKDDRIKAIYKSENTGVSDSRNRGLSIANGDFIGFVDSDDWIDPNMYFKMNESLIKFDADIAICSTRKVYSDRNEDLLVPNNESCISREEAFSTCLKYLGRGSNNMFLWNKLFRKNNFCILFLIFYTDIRYCEDILWVTEAFCKARKFVLCSDIGYYYRCLREGSSINLLNNGITDPINAYNLICKELINHNISCSNAAYQRMIDYKDILFRNAAKQGNIKMFRIGANKYNRHLFRWLWREKNYYALKWVVRKEISILYYSIILYN